MSKTSPTQRTLAKLRGEGYALVEVVERWNAHARVRNDLFGIIDVLAVGKDGDVLAVQCTSGSHVAERITKIQDSKAIEFLRRAGWTVHVHGWRKLSNGRWDCRTVDIS